MKPYSCPVMRTGATPSGVDPAIFRNVGLHTFPYFPSGRPEKPIARYMWNHTHACVAPSISIRSVFSYSHVD